MARGRPGGRCETGLRAGDAGQGCAWEMREWGCAREMREREYVRAWVQRGVAKLDP